MAESFKEYDRKGQDIMEFVENALICVEMGWRISFKSPHHDIARRLLNEIVEFKPLGEGE